VLAVDSPAYDVQEYECGGGQGCPRAALPRGLSCRRELGCRYAFLPTWARLSAEDLGRPCHPGPTARIL